jgi:hypothetical protein
MQLKAPKDFRENILYRQKILKLGNESKSAREEIILAASRDPIWFKDVFVFGFNPKDSPSRPQRPYISHPFQERLTAKLLAAIGKHDLVVPKSRAVGGTYDILATLFHQWLFRPMQSFLLASAKEDRVDRRGDPSSLFWKLDHFLKCLPGWMRPEFDRVEMRLENCMNGSIFNGESTNKNVDRGGRRTAILADEAAAMDNARNIAASIQHVTNCCIWLSTFQGAVGTFHDLYQKYSRESPDWVVKLGWWDHPEYSKGLTYDADGKPTSPWYRLQVLRAPGPKFVGQELDMEPNASGGQFFEQELVERLIKETIQNPKAKGEVEVNEHGQSQWRAISNGHLSLWCQLENGRPPKGDYGIGIDIASGAGGDYSSQSAFSVVDLKTGEKVAEYTNNRITPENYARYCVSAARFFHGAKLIWGSQWASAFGVIVTKECEYHHCYFYKDENIRGKRTRKYGYPEVGAARATLFGTYRDSLNSGRFSRTLIQRTRGSSTATS